MLGERVRLRIEARRLAGRVIGTDDQAGVGIAAVADAGDVPPGVRGIGGVDADRCAMDAPDRLLGRVRLATAGVVEHELVGGQRDRLADGSGAIPSARASATASAACSRLEA